MALLVVSGGRTVAHVAGSRPAWTRARQSPCDRGLCDARRAIDRQSVLRAGRPLPARRSLHAHCTTGVHSPLPAYRCTSCLCRAFVRRTSARFRVSSLAVHARPGSGCPHHQGLRQSDPAAAGFPSKPGPTASLLVACSSRRGAAPAGRGTRVALCGTGRGFATLLAPAELGRARGAGVRLAGANWVPALPEDGASGSVRDPPLLGDSGLRGRAVPADGAPRVEGAGVAGA